MAQEGTILNELGFELDTYPTFFDVVEIFMAQGVVYTSDALEHDGIRSPSVAPDDEERTVKQMEKHVDFFVLLSLQDHKLVNTN